MKTLAAPQAESQSLIAAALPFALAITAIAILAVILPHWIWSAASMAVFMGYVAVLAQRAPFSFALMLDFIFFRLTTLISGLGISMGAFMSEINLVGKASPAFPILALVYVGFTIAAATVVEKPVREAARKHLSQAPMLTHAFWVWPFFGVLALIGLYVFLVGAVAGFPLFTGMDRFVWRGQFEGDRVFGFFFSNRGIIGVVLGLIWLRSVGLVRAASITAFGGILGLSFLIGEKFTSIVLMLIGFVLPWMVHRGITNPWQDIRRFLVPAAALGTLLTLLTIPAVLLSYGFLENREAAVDMLLQRVSGQAQLWEAVTQENPPLFNYEAEVVALDKKLLVTGDTELAKDPPFAGIYYLMAAYMPFKAYEHYLLKGITLTMGFEPYILKQYGWLGMLLPLVAVAVVYGAHLAYLGLALVTCDATRLALILKLMVWVNFGLQQGDFWFILSSRNLMLIALIVAYEVWRGSRSKGATA